MTNERAIIAKNQTSNRFRYIHGAQTQTDTQRQQQTLTRSRIQKPRHRDTHTHTHTHTHIHIHMHTHTKAKNENPTKFQNVANIPFTVGNKYNVENTQIDPIKSLCTQFFSFYF